MELTEVEVASGSPLKSVGLFTVHILIITSCCQNNGECTLTCTLWFCSMCREERSWTVQKRWEKMFDTRFLIVPQWTLVWYNNAILWPNVLFSDQLYITNFPGLVVDWYPKHIEVQQEGTAVTVTFNLAPPNLGITSYFSLCYANGIKKYADLIPVSGFSFCSFIFCCFVFFKGIDTLLLLYILKKYLIIKWT